MGVDAGVLDGGLRKEINMKGKIEDLQDNPITISRKAMNEEEQVFITSA